MKVLRNIMLAWAILNIIFAVFGIVNTVSSMEKPEKGMLYTISALVHSVDIALVIIYIFIIVISVVVIIIVT